MSTKWWHEDVIEDGYNNGKRYVIRAYSVYQINYSQAQHCYVLMKLYTKPNRSEVTYSYPGHYNVCDAAFVNRIVGFDLLKSN